MPTVLRIGPYRFHFYSDERGEPAQIHSHTAAQPTANASFGWIRWYWLGIEASRRIHSARSSV